MEPFDIGDDVVLTLNFARNNAPVDPSTQTCTVVDPDGQETTVPLTRTSVGVFTGTFTPTVSGQHWCRAVGTGTAKAATEIPFHVRVQRVP